MIQLQKSDRMKRRRCPFCSETVPPAATWCEACGRNTPWEQKKGYEIVPDGEKYGIALAGAMIVAGLELEAAKVILHALTDREMREMHRVHRLKKDADRKKLRNG